MDSCLTEQAARRLEQLRQAGVQIPEIDADRQGAAAGQVHSPGSAFASAHGVAQPPSVAAPTQAPVAAPPSAPAVTSRAITIDLEALSAKGIVVPNAPRSFMADQYRVIKRPLITNAFGKGATPRVDKGNLIMVTSALSGEGKSFTSINLARRSKGYMTSLSAVFLPLLMLEHELRACSLALDPNPKRERSCPRQPRWSRRSSSRWTSRTRTRLTARFSTRRLIANGAALAGSDTD